MTDLHGQVVRSHGHVLYVQLGDEVLECRPRGKFRLHGDRVLVGDRVIVRRSGPGEGYIEKVLPRETVLWRPPVANVDQAVVVFTAAQPDLDWRTLDRFLVLAETAGLDIVLVLNKADLLPPGGAEAALAPYERLGYPMRIVSARTGAGVEELRPLLAGRLSVFAGQSGVGKSRLLNALEPTLNLRTGGVSRKVQRGRHTTRHVALLSLPGTDGAQVADTPGFSHVDFSEIEKEDLRFCFPEIRALEGGCRYRGCLHDQEPECAVQAAAASGDIHPSRYDNYLAFLAEISARPPRYR